MAIPLPLLRAAWRRQIAWCGLLALIAFGALATPSEAALPRPLTGVGETVRQTTDVVPAAREAVRANLEATVAGVRETARSVPALEPVVDAVDGERSPLAGAPRQAGDAIRGALSPVADDPARPVPSRPHADRGVGSIGDPARGTQRLVDATHDSGMTTRLTDAASGLAAADTRSSAASSTPTAHASSTSSNGGQDDDPGPGGPGATTGGVSGPLGFVLIAAVLAFVFGFAPRIISTPLRMSEAGGHDVALALPLERPD
jgi:hypothetical protein